MTGKYDEFLDGGVNAASNRAVTHLPENTWSASIHLRLGTVRGGRVGLLLDANYVDDYYLYAFPFANLGASDPASQNSALAGDTLVRSHTLVNARLSWTGVEWGSARFEAALWSRNLFDERYLHNDRFRPGVRQPDPGL